MDGTRSPLTDVVCDVNPNTVGPKRELSTISKITVHCMGSAAYGTPEGCAGWWDTLYKYGNPPYSSPGTIVSGGYAIGGDGRIGSIVPEEYVAWTSSNHDNDMVAITIEVSNTPESCDANGWPLAEKAYESLIKLCADICKRYNFKLYYDGTRNGSLTYHRMFDDKTCPGDWMVGKTDEFVKKVNALAGTGSLDFDSDSDDWDDGDYSTPTVVAYDYYLITSTEKSTKPGECGNKITGSVHLGRW